MSRYREWCGVLLSRCAIECVIGLQNTRPVIGCQKRNHVRGHRLGGGWLDLVDLDGVSLRCFAVSLVVHGEVRDGVFAFGAKAQLYSIAFDHRLGSTINRVVKLNDTSAAIVVGSAQRYSDIRLVPALVILSRSLCGCSGWSISFRVGEGVDTDAATVLQHVNHVPADFDLTRERDSPCT